MYLFNPEAVIQLNQYVVVIQASEYTSKMQNDNDGQQNCAYFLRPREIICLLVVFLSYLFQGVAGSVTFKENKTLTKHL